MSWTPEREKCLKEMWLSREYSAQQIADKLGNVTRNAVIGKANRLQLSKLIETAPSAKTKTTRKNVKNGNEIPKIDKQANEAIKKVKAKAKASNKDKVLNEPEFLNLKLLDLTDSTCKWPVNEEKVKDYCFCGVTTDSTSPYCEYHAQKAFHNLRTRQRKSA